jgi:hypothetical protein
MSTVRTERTAHPGPSGRVSARQGDLEPVSGFEPLTVRLQEGLSLAGSERHFEAISLLACINAYQG